MRLSPYGQGGAGVARLQCHGALRGVVDGLVPDFTVHSVFHADDFAGGADHELVI